MRIRCISVRQPYAEAILRGEKVREFRSRPVKPGPLAVHASLSISEEGCRLHPECRTPDAPLGSVVGLVEVVACEEASPGRFSWLLANPRRLSAPVPCRGQAAIFYVELPG